MTTAATSAARLLKRLESLGSEKMRQTLARHGVVGDSFGVKYADLSKLAKDVGTDHAVAEALWASANHDARVLATFVADPERLTATKLGTWLKAVTSGPLLDALARVAAGSPAAAACMEKWIASKQEWVAATGWQVFAALAGDGAASPLSEEACEGYLERIESAIHASPNRVKHSMNGALIAIGIRGERLQKAALAAAKRIGKVEVDHGETSCQTPDAAAYMLKVAAHRSAAASRPRAKARGR